MYVYQHTSTSVNNKNIQQINYYTGITISISISGYLHWSVAILSVKLVGWPSNQPTSLTYVAIVITVLLTIKASQSKNCRVIDIKQL